MAAHFVNAKEKSRLWAKDVHKIKRVENSLHLSTERIENASYPEGQTPADLAGECIESLRGSCQALPCRRKIYELVIVYRNLLKYLKNN